MPPQNASALTPLLARPTEDAPSGDLIQQALLAVRQHLGMEVAYVSQFVGNETVFRQVDAPGLEEVIKPGDSRSLDDVFCRHILAGRLPELMPDVAAIPFAQTVPITQQAPIGKHMSVPIRLTDGEVYGMFCCLGFSADTSLHERDLQVMRSFADIVAFEVNRDVESKKAASEKDARIRAVISENQLSVVYQPIWDVATRRPVGVESLTRFSAAPSRSPDKWFAEAAEAGLGAELELSVVRQALEGAAHLPPDAYVSVNLSPATIVHPALAEILSATAAERIVIEITEHADVGDYAVLHAALAPLRARGVRLAIDDAGAGYSCLRHILDLQPDLIKLDMSLVRNIALDPARKALAAALISFATQTNSQIIAEGVETAAEFAALQALGAQKVQGYYLSRPLPLADVTALFAEAPMARATG